MTLIDVYIVSRGDMTREKMELLGELWKQGIRAEADFGNDAEPSECSVKFAKFLVTFKKAVYATSKKVKVRELEKKGAE